MVFKNDLAIWPNIHGGDYNYWLIVQIQIQIFFKFEMK